MSDPIRPFGAPGTHLATGGKALDGAPLGGQFHAWPLQLDRHHVALCNQQRAANLLGAQEDSGAEAAAWRITDQVLGV